MINKEKWESLLPKKNNLDDGESDQINTSKWINTINKKNKYFSISKYSILIVLFVSGLMLIPVVKNETRNLEKEINSLKASIKILNLNLNQAKLDNTAITSPENISNLAQKHLNKDFSYYKKSQIKNINEKFQKIEVVNKITETSKLKMKIKKQIKEKKDEIKKLKTLYKEPKSIPKQLKNEMAKKIERKKIELSNLYSSPKEVLTYERIHRWSMIQLVKLFLGIPVVPGR